MKNIKLITLLVFTICMLFSCKSIKPVDNAIWHIDFGDANTRDNYNTYHKISNAHKYATGKGIKIGVLDKYFGYAHNFDLYTGGKDFLNNTSDFDEIGEHGLWMSTTLREIAPDASIYALGVRSSNRTKEKEAIIQAIEWAIENEINVLTYSGPAFRLEDRPVIDSVICIAISHGIITTFIHYDLSENILPYGFFSQEAESYQREPDINIFHFDYNVLLIPRYEKWIKSGRTQTDRIGDLPYFSFSSMSPVLAGIVALVLEIKPGLTGTEIKKILNETCYQLEYDKKLINQVADAEAAVKYTIQL